MQRLLALLSKTVEGKPVHGALALLSGLAEGMARSGQPLGDLLTKPSNLLRAAEEIAISDREAILNRVMAIGLVAEIKRDTVGPMLLGLLAAQEPPAVQTAAARGVSRIADRGLAQRRWPIGVNTHRACGAICWPRCCDPPISCPYSWMSWNRGR